MDFREQPLRAAGFSKLELSGAGFRPDDQATTGLLANANGGLRLRFDLPRAAEVSAQVVHVALNNYLPGYAAVAISVDGRTLFPAWASPTMGGIGEEASRRTSFRWATSRPASTSSSSTSSRTP